MGWRARPSAHKSPESNPGLTYQTQEGGGLAAKDGTNCGGRRVRAGAKPDPLKDKLEVGKPASRLLEPADLDPFGLDGVDMGEGAVLDGEYYARTFRLPVRDTALPPRDSSRCPVGFASGIVALFGPGAVSGTSSRFGVRHVCRSAHRHGSGVRVEAGCVAEVGGAARDVERPACLVSFCLRQPLSWRSSSSSHRSPKSVNVSICAETRLVVTSADSNKSRRVCGLPGLTPGK